MYRIKFYYIVDSEEYSLITNANKDDKNNYDMTIYYKKDNPKSAISSFEIDKANNQFFLLLIPGILFLFGIIMTIKNLIKLLRVRKLLKKEILVKNIPYMLIDDTVHRRNFHIYCITYTFPNGNTKELLSNGIHTKTSKEGECDLLYDPDDYSNYHIDKNIQTTGKGNPIVIYYQ